MNARKKTADTNPDYWKSYSNLQKVKHDLTREYLNGWLPKMTLGRTGCKRLLYMDTHAGRGKHVTGEYGSPLVALATLLRHTSRNDILQHTKVSFVFIERDQSNLESLKQELEKQKPLPDNVDIQMEQGDCFQIMDEALTRFEKEGKKLAPGFFFVDPYGFKVPFTLLQRVLNYRSVELFVNVMWRELDLAINNAKVGDEAAKETLQYIFGGDGWREIKATDVDARADECANVITRITGASWGTHIRMLDNGRTRYFLLHLTNHDAGRELIKTCMWKVCPSGGFYASKLHSAHQKPLMIEHEPNLRPLHEWAVTQLGTAGKKWQELDRELLEELFLSTHLTQVLREMRDRDEIEVEGKFTRTNDPLIKLKPPKPKKPHQKQMF